MSRCDWVQMSMPLQACCASTSLAQGRTDGEASPRRSEAHTRLAAWKAETDVLIQQEPMRMYTDELNMPNDG